MRKNVFFIEIIKSNYKGKKRCNSIVLVFQLSTTMREAACKKKKNATFAVRASPARFSTNPIDNYIIII